MRCVFCLILISSHRLTRLEFYLGATDTTPSAKCQRRPQIHRSMANPTGRHCRRRRTIAIQRSQRSSDACCPQRRCDVLDIRRLHHLGRKALRLGWLDLTAPFCLLHCDPTLLSSHPDGAAPPPAFRCRCAREGSASCLSVLSSYHNPTQPNPTPTPAQLLYYPLQCPTPIPAFGPDLQTRAFKQKTYQL